MRLPLGFVTGFSHIFSSQRHYRACSPPTFRLCGSQRHSFSVAKATLGTQKFTVLTWNVGGLRALLRKERSALLDVAERESPDLICLQEIRLQEPHTKDFEHILEGYTAYFNCSRARKGYAGNAVFVNDTHRLVSVKRTIGHEEGDAEGRTITMEFDDIFIISCYTPNAGDKLKRLPFRLAWDYAFRKYVSQLGAAGKPVIICGDLNVAHSEIDLHDPIRNRRSAGFTVEERKSFDALLMENGGLVDSFRALYPDRDKAYTFWNYHSRARERNAGWRIDYALVSPELFPQVIDCRILNHVMGSDHCPVVIDLKSSSNAL